MLNPRTCLRGPILACMMLALLFCGTVLAGSQRTDPQKYATSFLTATSATLTAGVQDLSALSPTTYPRMPLVDANGIVITPFLSAGTTSKNFRVWGGVTHLDTAGRPTKQGELFLLGTGTATAGTATGGTSLPIGATDLVCDQVTYTETSEATSPAGPSTDALDAFNSAPAQVYSPNDNTAACVMTLNLRRATFIIIEATGGSGGLNAMVQRVAY